MNMLDAIEEYELTISVVWVAFCLVVFSLGVYVAIHFIGKWW